MKFKSMNVLLFSFLITAFIACGDSTDGPDTNNENISQEEYDQLNRPCLNESNALSLPATLADMNNYAQYEQTILINTVLQLSNSLRESLSMGLYPPENAVAAEVDGITINANDTGYEWSSGGERYVYLLTNNGYQIYYYGSESLSGREVINVEQDENCEQFDYIQYAYKDEGDQQRGDIVFAYSFQQAGTAKIVDFGTDQYKSDSESYRMRTFEDLSGELTIKTGGKVSQNIFWSADGSGSYQIIENSQVIDEGTWSF
ncbi:MAG: hypothetical protein P1U56_13180 [Saprospiraceae bacterium]|nr:hypothetical protein [Saprospiraceae bacterium]